MIAEEFRQHRESLLKVFKQNNVNNGTIAYKSGLLLQEPFTGSDLEFYQEALFFWLTGWEKPDSAVTIDIESGKTTLFIPEYDDHYEIWVGPIPSEESIKEKTGVDEINFTKNFNDSLKGVSGTIYATPIDMIQDSEVTALLAAAGIARRIKTKYEIDTIRKASEVTSKAIVEVMKAVKPGMRECDVDLEFQYHGTKAGGRHISFLTIAASGQNSVFLHSSSNNGTCKDGELLLLDCGMFVDHYAGDVTRTFPINGKFTPSQRLVYDTLLKYQIELEQNVKPGLKMSDMNTDMQRCTFEVLRAVGVVPEDAEFSLTVARFFTPHGLTHHLGCNVHDHNYYKSEIIKDSADAARTLEPGMVITIEPGVYFHRARLIKAMLMGTLDPMINAQRALQLANEVGGIRIEDDVLVTETGFEVLTPCPKTSEEIEAIMAH